MRQRKSSVARWCDDITNSLTSKYDHTEYVPLSDHLDRVERKINVVLFVIVFMVLVKSLGYAIGIIIALLDTLIFSLRISSIISIAV